METEQILDNLYEEFEETPNTQEIIDNLYGIKTKKQQVEDYFASRNVIPLGTKRLFEDYRGFIPANEEVNLPIPYNVTDNPLNIAHISMSGSQKTRETKNIVLAIHKLNYNIMIFQPKSNDWENAVRYGTGLRLHPTLKNTTLPLKNYVPSFLRDVIDEFAVHKYKLFSPSLAEFKDTEDWENLGVSLVARTTIASYVKEGVRNLNELKGKIKANRELAPSAKNSAITIIENLKRLEFFTHKKIDFDNDWNKLKKIILITFFARKGGYMNVNISKPIDELIDYARHERDRGIEYITRKMVVFEDSAFYASFDNKYVSKQIANVQNNLRAFGINSLFVVQIPDLVDKVLLDSSPIKIIGNISNPDTLRPIIPARAYEILKNKELYIDEDNYIFQRILIRGNRVQKYFPYDCQTGHI